MTRLLIIAPTATTPRAARAGSNAPFRGTDVVPGVADEPVIGVAIGEAGEYNTPLTVAATWNTDPPPNS